MWRAARTSGTVDIQGGAEERNVNTFVNRKTGLFACRPRQLAKLGIIGLAHVRKLRPELRPPLPNQRVGALQIDMVRHNHNRSRFDRWIEGPSGVGRDHDLGPEETGQSYRRYDLFGSIALIEVEATVEHHQTLALPAPQGHGLPVSHQRVEGKGQNLFEIDLLGGFPARNLELETGSRNQQSADATRAIPVTKLVRHDSEWTSPIARPGGGRAVIQNSEFRPPNSKGGDRDRYHGAAGSVTVAPAMARIRLRSVKLTGFKSFPDEVELAFPGKGRTWSTRFSGFSVSRAHH